MSCRRAGFPGASPPVAIGQPDDDCLYALSVGYSGWRSAAAFPKVRRSTRAAGSLTPGFVDVHTHYDAQVTWSERLSPSSWSGATTVLLGNCGVGFAPCHEDQRDMLINLMEDVEDIPEVVTTAGLPWNRATASPTISMPSPSDATTSMSRPRCRTPRCAST